MESELTTIYIVRHGEAQHNVAKLYGEIPESSLTSKGQNQAKELAKKFEDIHFDYVFASDFVRAKQTAQILIEEKKLIVNTSKALRERSYGKMNGKTEEEMRRELKEVYDNYRKQLQKDQFKTRLVEDMETTEEALQRVLLFLREVSIAYKGKTILIVSHVTLMRALIIHLGYADFEEIISKNIENTAYLKIKSDGVDFFLEEVIGVHKTISDNT